MIVENALIRGIFTHASSHSKLGSKLLSSNHRQKEVTHSPRQHFLENLFSPTVERGAGNENLLYQNSVRCDESNFFKCDGFTILEIIYII